MKLVDLENKSILVLGLGRDGLSAVNFLNKHLPNQKIAVADKVTKECDSPNIGERFFGDEYLDAAAKFNIVIKSPGIKPLSRKTITSANIFFDTFTGKIIGVTGTKGKSTTASLIYEVLKKGGIRVEFLGNIGKPCLDYLDSLSEDTVVVFELSSYYLHDLVKSPHISVITNIYPEHLDWHGNFDQYIQSKANITKYQSENDFLIFNQNDSRVVEIANATRAKKLPYSPSTKLDDTQPARVVGGLFNIPDRTVSEAIGNFSGLEHRLEFVGEYKGIKFYNDSLATVPQATIGALEKLSDVETLIAGGFDRGIDYAPMGEAIKNCSVKTLILFPDTGSKIWNALDEQAKQKIKKVDVDNMKDAVRVAFEKTPPGKICLLSPASSSFNLFKDYADRGHQFKDEVKNF